MHHHAQLELTPLGPPKAPCVSLALPTASLPLPLDHFVFDLTFQPTYFPHTLGIDPKQHSLTWY